MKGRKWLNTENLIAMIPIGRVIKSCEINRLVDGFNKGDICEKQIKEFIKNTKKVSLAEFLKG